MFSLWAVHLTNFKSYAGKHSFEFPSEAGLYFLTGKNDKEPRLEANGAGKSTLLDAIFWCLYGKTLRGLKGSDIVTWGEKGAAVKLRLLIGDEELEISRTQNPNTLTVNGTNVDQEALTKQIGMTPDAFCYAVMMPQHNQSFFELTPTGKLALFSEIMGLDSWLALSQHAAKTAQGIFSDISKYCRQVEALTISTSSASLELEDLRERDVDFDSAQKKDIARLKAGSLELEDELEALVPVKAMPADDLEHAEKAYITQNKVLTDLHRKYIGLSVRVERDASLHKALLGLEGICSKCLQPISGKHLKASRAEASEKLEISQNELKAAKNKWSEASALLRNIAEDVAFLAQEQKDAARAADQTKAEATRLKARFQALKASIETEQRRTNPYTALVLEKEKLLVGYGARQKKLNEEIAALNADHAAVEFWIGGFKRIRLFIIEEALSALEMEVNNSLTNLGLIGWQVEFDVERENRTGGLTKGFVVLVKSPGHPEPVRWEAWSGGESQRLQLAGDLGLATLIMQRAGLQNTIEFYDEPSQHLSKAGVLDLTETLYQRAVDDGKRIFLVDHNMPEFGDFAGVITVTKNEHGSEIA